MKKEKETNNNKKENKNNNSAALLGTSPWKPRDLVSYFFPLLSLTTILYLPLPRDSLTPWWADGAIHLCSFGTHFIGYIALGKWLCGIQ